MTDSAPHEARRYVFIRLHSYFHERFPVVQHGVLIAAYSLGTLFYVSRLHPEALPPEPSAIAVSFTCAFLIFLQLRILDEFSDYHDDLQQRPSHPISRGLVSLPELGWLLVLTAVLQITITMLFQAKLLVMLLVIWAFAWLMKVDFFVPNWLNKRQLALMASHILIIPLITLYIAAHGPHMPDIRALIWLLLMSYFSYFIIEIGRKIRSPDGEEAGISTYSKMWGVSHAVIAWLIAMLVSSILAVMAATQVGTALPTLFGCSLLWLTSLLVSLRFIHRPAKRQGKLIKLLSGIWVIMAYVLVGTGLGFTN